MFTSEEEQINTLKLEIAISCELHIRIEWHNHKTALLTLEWPLLEQTHPLEQHLNAQIVES